MASFDDIHRRKPAPEDQLSVQVTRLEHGVEIRVAGELDLMTAPMLQAAFADTRSVACVVLDTSELTFVDCAGLRVLIEAASREDDGRLVLTEPSPALRRLLNLSGCNHLFRFS